MSKGTAYEDDFVDIKELIKKHSVEELNRTAEEYFSRLENWDRHLAKPFASSTDAVHLLVQMSYLIQGLELYHGMTILEFGAGSCWVSRMLNQMGFEVISLDVSATALKMGTDLKRKHPVFGDQPDHRFLHFDGEKMCLEDTSVDRIFCMDAFHHVPNQREVLAEMSRVLKKGGIAGFSEPGPTHSRTPDAQFTMRHFKVIENDIVLEDIFEQAKSVGFTDMTVSIGSTYPMRVPLARFRTFLTDTELTVKFLLSTNDRVTNFPIFFLHKGRAAINDSRNRDGLVAEIVAIKNSINVNRGEELRVGVVIKNTSKRRWLRSGEQPGCVNIGYFLHKVEGDGSLMQNQEFRLHLSSDGVMPGESVATSIVLSRLEVGEYRVDIGLVSEHICWFHENGSKITSVEIVVN